MKIYKKDKIFVKIRKAVTPPSKPFKNKVKYNRKENKKLEE
jgi:hypothetical protein